MNARVQLLPSEVTVQGFFKDVLGEPYPPHNWEMAYLDDYLFDGNFPEVRDAICPEPEKLVDVWDQAVLRRIEKLYGVRLDSTCVALTALLGSPSRQSQAPLY